MRKTDEFMRHEVPVITGPTKDMTTSKQDSLQSLDQWIILTKIISYGYS